MLAFSRSDARQLHAVPAQLRGYGSDSAPPSFSETEEAVLAGGGAAAAPPDELAAWRLGARQRLGRVARLEQVWQESIRDMHSFKSWQWWAA